MRNKNQNFYTAVHLRDEFATVYSTYEKLLGYIKHSWGELYIDFDCEKEATHDSIQARLSEGDPARGILLYSGKFDPAIKVQCQTLEVM